MLVSERDRGVYDAMNKGIDRATGSMLWFLNGGDACAIEDWPALRAQLTHPDRLVLGAYWLSLGSRRLLRPARDAGYMWHGLPTSHQAILYPRELAARTRYDLSYRVAADYDFTARTLAAGAETQVIAAPLAVFDSGGLSQRQSVQVAKEALAIKKAVLHVPAPLRFVSYARQRVTSTARLLLSR